MTFIRASKQTLRVHEHHHRHNDSRAKIITMQESKVIGIKCFHYHVLKLIGHIVFHLNPQITRECLTIYKHFMHSYTFQGFISFHL